MKQKKIRIFTLKLPESLNAKLPQTMEEGEQFGKDFNGWNDTIEQISRYLYGRSSS